MMTDNEKLILDRMRGLDMVYIDRGGNWRAMHKNVFRSFQFQYEMSPDMFGLSPDVIKDALRTVRNKVKPASDIEREATLDSLR
jgi:hypothetical protein